MTKKLTKKQKIKLSYEAIRFEDHNQHKPKKHFNPYNEGSQEFDVYQRAINMSPRRRSEIIKEFNLLETGSMF